MDIRAAVLEAVQAVAQAPVPADPAASLFDGGVLDSFALMDLVSRLEETLDVQVPDGELVPSRFESVDMIVAYFQARR